MKIQISVQGVDGNIMGSNSVDLVAEKGKLRTVEPPVVRIAVSGIVAHVKGYIPDLDLDLTFSINSIGFERPTSRYGDPKALKPGDTIALPFEDYVLEVRR